MTAGRRIVGPAPRFIHDMIHTDELHKSADCVSQLAYEIEILFRFHIRRSIHYSRTQPHKAVPAPAITISAKVVTFSEGQPPTGNQPSQMTRPMQWRVCARGDREVTVTTSDNSFLQMHPTMPCRPVDFQMDVLTSSITIVSQV